MLDHCRTEEGRILATEEVSDELVNEEVLLRLNTRAPVFKHSAIKNKEVCLIYMCCYFVFYTPSPVLQLRKRSLVRASEETDEYLTVVCQDVVDHYVRAFSHLYCSRYGIFVMWMLLTDTIASSLLPSSIIITRRTTLTYQAPQTSHPQCHTRTRPHPSCSVGLDSH